MTSIFKRAKDLIDPLYPTNARAAGYELLTACTRNSDLSDLERLAFFHVITSPGKAEDFHRQLAALIELTKNGRDLAGFHYEILPLLTSWLQQTSSVSLSHKKNLRGIASMKQKTDLTSLLIFIVDVLKFSFNVSNEQTIGDLIEVVLNICIRTQSSDDLRSCINVINAIVTYGDIPSGNLAECVKVLCSIFFNPIHEVQKEVWQSMSNICISHNGKNTARIIFSILNDPSHQIDQRICEIRGALLVMEKLFSENGQNGFPPIPFSILIKSVSNVALVENPILRNDIVRLILSLINGDEKEVVKNVMEEDWALMFEVIKNCASCDMRNTELEFAMNSSVARSLTDKEMKIASAKLSQNLQNLILRIQTLLTQHSGSDFFRRVDCVKFLLSMHRRLPEACARLVIDIYMEYRYCYPSDLDWKDNLVMILKSFFYNRLQSTEIRLHALKAVTEVFNEVEAVNGFADTKTTHMFLSLILEDISNEKDILILQEIMEFVVAVADATLDNNFFFLIIDTVHQIILSQYMRSQSTFNSISKRKSTLLSQPDSSTTPDSNKSTPSNIVAKVFIQIFISSIKKSRTKVIRTFDEILWIVENNECEPDARLSALSLLLRMRADWANRIFLISFTESDDLAALFHRNPCSLSKNHAGITTKRQCVSQEHNLAPLLGSSLTDSTKGLENYTGNSTSSNQQFHQHIHQMWLEPNDYLSSHPENCKASSILFSILGSETNENDTYDTMNYSMYDEQEGVTTLTKQEVFNTEHQPIALNIARYLQIITSLVQDNCNWEIYSYILLHLPSQLANQALFNAAIPQIRALREVLCNQIKNNSIQGPPASCGLRKSDVAVCFFQILNVVMSYHRYFSKNEEDDIVRTFLHGLGEKTSRCCIHSLSVCCHELPGSTSKVLVTLLTKMSQIITQSHVAIHILEFLACLARLPNLYVNFREEEYRIVFAICFRYLQYVRDQKFKEISARRSSPNLKTGPENFRAFSETISPEIRSFPASSDDLPEYVCALAYHVIIFWFLSLKLVDRAGQVHWIAKNLVSMDANGKETIDEQAEVTLDFMQRVAYANVEESGPDPSFRKEIFGEINRKRWVVGNSLLTIEQTIRGDWAQITKHQPSGTSCYIIQKNICHSHPHQTQDITGTIKDIHHTDESIKLPSHLLLQLYASIPISVESMRPIPLPDCKAVDRAVSNLDRTFTVVGHKVGVIYIGENQTNEVEILANIQGSSDYTRFLSGLGTLTKLRGANFNTQGLDRQADTDGEYTFCWRDRVSEIIFHVTTQMPTDLYNDPQCSNKKKHIGNDFVNIIFNNSGLPFNFDTFPSEFNFVNIVIIPESRANLAARRLSGSENIFYKVQVMSRPGFPEISPAAETKIMSLPTLPDFVRLLALNASVFSLAWAQRDGGEYFSSWRSRLQEIKKMRETFGIKNPNTSPSSTSQEVAIEGRNVRESINSLRRSSVANFLTPIEPVSQRPIDTNICKTEIRLVPSGENLVESLDFSRWA